MTLFEECIGVLGKHVSVIEKNMAGKILSKFDEDFPISPWGRIDWELVREKQTITSFEYIIPAISGRKRDISTPVYVIGSDPTIPIMECKLDTLLEFFYDVEAVSPNSWFYSLSGGWVLEIYHDGSLTVGFVE
jgi:hypothetical protein